MRKIILLILCLGVLSWPLTAVASTSAEKQKGIDAGLAYLANTQNANGSWSYGGYEPAATAAALLSFVDQRYKPLGWDGADYNAVVTNATNYLLSQASTLNISTPNWWGFSGTANSGVGIRWYNSGEETYGSGLAIPALSRLVSNPYGGTPLVSPTTVISSPNAAVNGKTYSQVIQQAVDSFTWSQTGPAYGDRYGGWRYFAGQNDSDMSTTQWPVIDYLFAKQVPGVSVPGAGSNTATALQAWLTADQYTSGINAGGVDYQPGAGIVNATHAGAFLLSNYFAGGGGVPAAALAWLNAHWTEIASGTWYGNIGNPYAMWAVYKGLETIYGTTGAGPITNLDPQTTLIDPGATWNWWEDYCQYLVGSQNADGSWTGYAYWTGPLATAWDINILNATATAPPGVPEPCTLLLLGFGLAGLAVFRKRRRLT